MPDEDAGAGSGDDACWLDRVCDACSTSSTRSARECRRPGSEGGNWHGPRHDELVQGNPDCGAVSTHTAIWVGLTAEYAAIPTQKPRCGARW